MDLVANRAYINREFYNSVACNFDWSVYYTTKECHIAMWNTIIDMIKENNKWVYCREVSTLKCCALNELGFDSTALDSLCYACTIAGERAKKAVHHDACKFCPLKHSCYLDEEEEEVAGHYKKFCNAFYDKYIEEMVKYAEYIRDDWKERD